MAGVSTTSRTQHEMTRDPYPFLCVLEICLFKVMGIIHSSLLKITKSKKMSNIILNQLFTLNEFSRYDNLWIELELYSMLVRVMGVLGIHAFLKTCEVSI